MPPLAHLCVVHLSVKLPFGDANDRGNCYHISPSNICTHTPTHTHAHTHLQGFLLLPVFVCMCSPLALFISQSSCHCSYSPFSFSVSPFLSPCNSTLSPLVSCHLANTDCSRSGLDFPVLTSSLVCFLSLSISLHPLPIHSLSCVLLPHTLLFLVWFLRTCVFLENIPPSCSLLSLLKSRTFFLFQTSDLFLFLLLLSPNFTVTNMEDILHITLVSEKISTTFFCFHF